MKPITLLTAMLLTATLFSQTCNRELLLTNWLDQYGNDCWLTVPMYKNVNGLWVYVTSFENNVPQTVQVEYGGYYKWDLSWCDNSTECATFTISEQCGFQDQIEFTWTACPPADYKLIIDKVLWGYRDHDVCDQCPD